MECKDWCEPGITCYQLPCDPMQPGVCPGSSCEPSPACPDDFKPPPGYIPKGPDGSPAPPREPWEPDPFPTELVVIPVVCGLALLCCCCFIYLYGSVMADWCGTIDPRSAIAEDDRVLAEMRAEAEERATKTAKKIVHSADEYWLNIEAQLHDHHHEMDELHRDHRHDHSQHLHGKMTQANAGHVHQIPHHHHTNDTPVGYKPTEQLSIQAKVARITDIQGNPAVRKSAAAHSQHGHEAAAHHHEAAEHNKHAREESKASTAAPHAREESKASTAAPHAREESKASTAAEHVHLESKANGTHVKKNSEHHAAGPNAKSNGSPRHHSKAGPPDPTASKWPVPLHAPGRPVPVLEEPDEEDGETGEKHHSRGKGKHDHGGHGHQGGADHGHARKSHARDGHT
eukprot:gnl/TRDRNA2_/TRDRNA2_82803_c0_seq1.p1 gnl/TRDRNA2_/TRDRNA2_82803_c0~~gnl/TRDRNA2_/TRDRNA2_82803_c0_seq1.p1  ORF type:complete len:444 (+),score=74.05 gnl/TRDRNA2_/TRDRNA2_82803_c0_seq1:133-1332(+)